VATILVIDIDGTIANIDHRLHFAEESPPDWDSFFDPDIVSKDKPIARAQEALPKLIKKYGKPYFLTGRPDNLKNVTKTWLKKHFNLDSDDYKLLMREEGDYKPSESVKKTIIERSLPKDGEFIFVDDEIKNLDMMSQHGEALSVPEAWDVLTKETKKGAIMDWYADLEKIVEVLESANAELASFGVAPREVLEDIYNARQHVKESVDILIDALANNEELRY